MQVQPITPSFGVDISDCNLTTVDDEVFKQIYQLWLQYGVLRFRDQTLSDDQLQAFSAKFGRLDTIPYFDKMGVTEEEFKRQGGGSIYILQLSNIEKDGKPIGGLGDGEAVWHADMTSHKEPGIGMVLYSEIIPSKGGDTQFADQYGAYNSLPTELKNRIQNLSIKHDRTHTSDGKLRQGFEEVASGDPRDAPGQLHPIVYTHPETAKKALYLGRRAWAYIDGLSLQDSEALLDELWTYATDDKHVITHQWRVGDVIAWDNRSILHRRDGFNEPRLLKRCQLLNSNQ
tara:strand:- start:3377 stop:4237 length:861 start_codon:yes stop_codon:yes gene_type:complete